MLPAHMVERPDDAALEKGPCALNAVGVYLTADPLLDRMVEGLVSGVGVRDARVGHPLVSVFDARLGW